MAAFSMKLFKLANPENEVKHNLTFCWRALSLLKVAFNLFQPQNARKFFKDSLVHTEGKLANATPDTLKSI